MEPGTSAKDKRTVESELYELARWLNLDKVTVQRWVK
jgi:hypothetical protein